MGCHYLGISVELQVWGVILWEYGWSLNGVGCHSLGIRVEFQ